MWKKIGWVLAALIGGGVAVDNVDSTKEKIHNTGEIVTAITDEAGNVVNEGVNSVQTGVGSIGTPETATTLAPEPGSGRG